MMDDVHPRRCSPPVIIHGSTMGGSRSRDSEHVGHHGQKWVRATIEGQSLRTHQLARSVLVEEPPLSRAADRPHSDFNAPVRMGGWADAAREVETGEWSEVSNDKRGVYNHTVR